MTRREVGLGLALLLAGACTALAWLREPIQTQLHQGAPQQQTLILVVLDTVRADHLSVCGYERPTAPTLEALVADGASLSCQAYATGSWTYPSHASLFTGLEVPEHGAHFVGDQALLRALAIQPLDPSLPLLSEELGARGYQSLGISGNPVLVEASGLGRGFDDWRVSPGFGGFAGDKLVAQVRESLRAADPDKPLFLFVNIADAHDPWYPASELDWVPAHPGTLAYFEVDDKGQVLEDGPWQRYVQGRMPEDEAQALRTEVQDRYDRALHQADATLASVLETVRDHGWDQAGMRVVVTSDHGEFLGEHGILRHGRYLYEENSRVPLLVWESAGVDGAGVGGDGAAGAVGGRSVGEGAGGGRAAAPLLPPGPLSMLEARSVLLTGQTAGYPVRAVAFPDPLWTEQSKGALGTEMSVAVWGEQGRKQHWLGGESWLLDLQADPLEQAPSSVEPSAQVQERLEAARESAARQQGGMDPGLEAALRAAGYLE